MPWVLRGLRRGIVTTPYPRRPDDYGPGFHATVSLRRAGSSADVCPTAAIGRAADGSAVTLDRGRCIACGRCVDASPEHFAFDSTLELASVGRAGLVVPTVPETDETLAALRDGLRTRSRAFGRSLHIRHVDAGSDGGEEWEVAALANPVYDIHRLGVFFTASPRHADLLLVTGVGSPGMAEPLRHTYEAMPTPRIVLAAGTDAASGGLHRTDEGERSGIDAILPVDVFVPGSPPSPFSLMHGILLALGRLGKGRLGKGGGTP